MASDCLRSKRYFVNVSIFLYYLVVPMSTAYLTLFGFGLLLLQRRSRRLIPTNSVVLTI